MKKIALTLALPLATLVVAILWNPDPAPARGSGEPVLESIGALTFGPSGVLFVADSFAARIVAFELDEQAQPVGELELSGVDRRIAELLGTERDRVEIHDLAVSPVSHAAYLSVSRGPSLDEVRIKHAPLGGRTSHLIRIGPDGLSEVGLTRLRSSRASLRDVRDAGVNRWGQDRRSWNIVEMQFVDGTLYVSGISNEEWSSKIRRIRYPFVGGVESSSLRIFHTAHGRWETDAPARVFAPFERNGVKGIFAGFSCTPLVEIALADLESHDRVEGRTIAELGPGNHVLDMISVRHEGETHFLLANHLHPFMTLALDDFEGARGLTRGTIRAGIDRRPLAPTGITRLANLGAERVAMLRDSDGRIDLTTSSVAELLGARCASRPADSGSAAVAAR